MKLSSKLFSSVVLTLLCVALLSCKPEVPPARAPQTGALIAPQPTQTTIISALPTPTINPEDIEPTIPPSPTMPPVPTPLPTPVVTPIPVASAPFIPEVVGKAQQPFWIYYWQGNEVWRVDDQGKDRQLVIDTYKTLGQYLTAEPYLENGAGLRVSVSSDDRKLALVLVDRPGLAHKDEKVTFSIYLFDVATGGLKFLSEGGWPRWSPDSKHLAFRRGTAVSDGFEWDRGLYVADLNTGQIEKLVEADPVRLDFYVSNWVWSPDSRQIVYQFNQGYQSLPGIWMIDLEKKSPSLIPETDKLVDQFPMGVHIGDWLPDGQHLLAMAEDPTRGLEHLECLWILDVNNGEIAQLTREMSVNGAILSPDGKWFAINATRLYERAQQPHDIWLLSIDGTKLLRVTAAPPEDIGGLWSPDVTRLIFLRKDMGLVTLALDNAKVTVLGFDPGFSFAVGGAK